jgi:hypothetical protein
MIDWGSWVYSRKNYTCCSESQQASSYAVHWAWLGARGTFLRYFAPEHHFRAHTSTLDCNSAHNGHIKLPMTMQPFQMYRNGQQSDSAVYLRNSPQKCMYLDQQNLLSSYVGAWHWLRLRSWLQLVLCLGSRTYLVLMWSPFAESATLDCRSDLGAETRYCYMYLLPSAVEAERENHWQL